jgi:mono/diheme cytochrome c family protein
VNVTRFAQALADPVVRETRILQRMRDTKLRGLSAVMRGLDPRIHLLRITVFTKMMDCRVKPGNDAWRGSDHADWYDILRIGFLLAAAVVVHIAPVKAQSAADAGRQVYAEHCEQCHGERLMATGAAPDLKLLRADQRPRFDEIVREGKGQMPPWAGMITDDEIDQIWAYVRSRAEN